MTTPTAVAFPDEALPERSAFLARNERLVKPIIRARMRVQHQLWLEGLERMAKTGMP